MKTRVKKWARYRREIQKTPMERFETKKAKPIANETSTNAAPSLYELYRKKQIRLATLQGAVCLLCLVAFIVWYAVWVR